MSVPSTSAVIGNARKTWTGMPCSSAVVVLGTTRSPSCRTMPSRREQVADGARTRDDRAGLPVDRDGDVAARVGAAEHLRDDADERGAARDDERGDDEPTAQPQRAPVVRDRRAVRPQLRVRLGDGQRLELGDLELRRGRDRRRASGAARAGRGRGRRAGGGRTRRSGAAAGAGSGGATTRSRLGRAGRRARPVEAGVASDRGGGRGARRRSAAGVHGTRQHAGEERVLVLGGAPEVGLELGELAVEVDAALLDLEQLELAREVEGRELRGQVDREPRVRLRRLLAGRRRLHRAQRIAPRACVDAREPRVAASQMLADRVRLPVRRPHSAAAG